MCMNYQAGFNEVCLMAEGQLATTWQELAIHSLRQVWAHVVSPMPRSRVSKVFAIGITIGGWLAYLW